eukprot:c32460_g1_i1.p1 GENE.c32460_g1_i1~~c32460_g1_i1.p1  ORF type:complete len:463 (+),score=87.15 c32460_g1_i1:88-1476(+)
MSTCSPLGMLRQAIFTLHHIAVPVHLAHQPPSSYRIFTVSLFAHWLIKPAHLVLHYLFLLLVFLKLAGSFSTTCAWVTIFLPKFASSFLACVSCVMALIRSEMYKDSRGGEVLRNFQFPTVGRAALVSDVLSWTLVSIFSVWKLDKTARVASYSAIVAPFFLDLPLRLANGFLNRASPSSLKPVDSSLHQITLILAALKMDGILEISWATVAVVFWISIIVVAVASVVACVSNILSMFFHRPPLRSLIPPLCLLFASLLVLVLALLPELLFLNAISGNLSTGEPISDSVFAVLSVCLGWSSLALALGIFVFASAVKLTWDPQSVFVTDFGDFSPQRPGYLRRNLLLKPLELFRQSHSLFHALPTSNCPDQVPFDFPPQGGGEDEEDAGSSGNCVACEEVAVQTIFLPCGHSVACFACAERWVSGQQGPKCILCRQSVERFVRVDRIAKQRTISAFEEYRVES